MSELLRIGLVAEGPTDYEIINAALNAMVLVPFKMTLLQPEATQTQFGGGWGGVLKWCHEASQRHSGALLQDPTLSLFDVLILHLDADVAAKSYTDCGPAVPGMAQAFSWGPLPCSQPCPPAATTCAALEQVLLSWLGAVKPDFKTLCCIPAQSTGTWLASAVLEAAHPLLEGAECNQALENRLPQLPKKQRIRKTVPDYRLHAPAVAQHWPQVKTVCAQAAAFEGAVRAWLQQAGINQPNQSAC